MYIYNHNGRHDARGALSGRLRAITSGSGIRTYRDRRTLPSLFWNTHTRNGVRHIVFGMDEHALECPGRRWAHLVGALPFHSRYAVAGCQRVFAAEGTHCTRAFADRRAVGSAVVFHGARGVVICNKQGVYVRYRRCAVQAGCTKKSTTDPSQTRKTTHRCPTRSHDTRKSR